jgi:integrase
MIEAVRHGSELLFEGTDLGKIPLFITDERVVWEPTRWLIERHEEGIAIGSVKTYGGHILDFYRQLEVDGRGIDEVDDAYLTEYHNALLLTAPNTAGQYLRSVIDHLKWLEDKGIARGLIGNGDGFKVNLDGGGNWLSESYSTKRSNREDAPPTQAVEAVKSYLQTKVDEFQRRDELMIDWQLTVGLRAMEVCGLLLRDIPSRESSEKKLSRGKTIRIVVVGKGRRARSVSVAPSLIFNTLDWVDAGRRQILSRLPKSDVAAADSPSGALFISLSGKALLPASLSNKIRAAYLAARQADAIDDDVRVWSHGLRHRFATDDHKARNDAGQPRAAFHTKQALGHRDIGTTGDYIHDETPEEIQERQAPWRRRR